MKYYVIIFVALLGMSSAQSFADGWTSPFHYGQGVYNRGNGVVGDVVNPDFGGWVLIRPFVGGPIQEHDPASLTPLLTQPLRPSGKAKAPIPRLSSRLCSSALDLWFNSCNPAALGGYKNAWPYRS
jgi:hypothetical protein